MLTAVSAWGRLVVLHPKVQVYMLSCVGLHFGDQSHSLCSCRCSAPLRRSVEAASAGDRYTDLSCEQQLDMG